jgi:hypothetical protein
LTEVQVISYLSSCWLWFKQQSIRLKFDIKSIELELFLILFGILQLHLQLSRKVVQNIHLSGGSLLGVSRGGPGVDEIVNSLEVVDPFY